MGQMLSTMGSYGGAPQGSNTMQNLLSSAAWLQQIGKGNPDALGSLMNHMFGNKPTQQQQPGAGQQTEPRQVVPMGQLQQQGQQSQQGQQQGDFDLGSIMKILAFLREQPTQ
jgi:hypothetical protein